VNDEDGGHLDRNKLTKLHPIPPKDHFRFKIGIIIIVVFALLMGMSLYAALFRGNSGNGMEAMNLLGHVFGPLLGMIIAFYFAAELNQ
jgi:hypothetical protein